MTLEAVLRDALTLSPRERAALADQLWRSIPHDEAELALTPAQQDDLKRRLREDDAAASDPQDWEQARTELRGKE